MSPSSLAEYKRCNHKFYLKRQSEHDWPTYTQSMAAAVGSAFDAFVKDDIAKILGRDDEHVQLDYLLENSVDATVRSSAEKLGRLIFRDYKRMGMVDRLMARGVEDIELSKKSIITDGETEVPVYFKADMLFKDGMPGDWKVQGAMSSASPAPGYCFGRRGNKQLPPHDKMGYNLEEINPQWAAQAAIYYWGYNGMLPWRPAPALIENITRRNSTTTCTTIDTEISVEFQQKLWQDLTTSWKHISHGEHEKPVFDVKRCHAYNTLCEVSDLCEAYQRELKGEQTKEDMLNSILGR